MEVQNLRFIGELFFLKGSTAIWRSFSALFRTMSGQPYHLRYVENVPTIFIDQENARLNSKQTRAQHSFNLVIISDKLISQIHPTEGWNIIFILVKLKE